MTDFVADSFTGSLTTAQLAVVALAALLVTAAVVFTSFRLPGRIQLGAVVALGLVQFYGPLGFMSAALFFTVMLLPAAIVRTWPTMRSIWPMLIALLAAWQLISVLWSATLGSAAFGVLGTLALLTAFLLGEEMVRQGRQSVRTVMLFALPVVWLEAGATIIFRFAPSAERAYLSSAIAPFLTEPGVEEIAAGGAANVLDEGKSGGLLLNGNIASLLLGMSAMLFFATAAYLRSRVALVTAVIALFGTFATGSKTPLVLLPLLIAVVGVTVAAVRRVKAAAIVASVAVAALIALATAVSFVAPQLVAQATRTMGERGVLWGLVWEQVPEHWLLGLGFGNWREYMLERAAGGDPADPTMRVLPPHNLFLQAWVDAGLVALVLTVAVAIIPLAWAGIAIWRGRHAAAFNRRAIIVYTLTIAVSWPLVHGLTDTTIFSGDNHTIVLYGIAVAGIRAFAREDSGRNTQLA